MPTGVSLRTSRLLNGPNKLAAFFIAIYVAPSFLYFKTRRAFSIKSGTCNAELISAIGRSPVNIMEEITGGNAAATASIADPHTKRLFQPHVYSSRQPD